MNLLPSDLFFLDFHGRLYFSIDPDEKLLFEVGKFGLTNVKFFSTFDLFVKDSGGFCSNFDMHLLDYCS